MDTSHNIFDYICEAMESSIQDVRLTEKKGRVLQVVGAIVRASIDDVRIGEMCLLRNPEDNYSIYAEVVGFVEGSCLLTPLGDLKGISSDTEVIPTRKPHTVEVSDKLLGRVLDGMGITIDQNMRFDGSNTDLAATDIAKVFSMEYPLHRDPPEPLSRKPITKPLSLGVKAIDGFMTCGEGQRLGVFAAAGVGKSTLLGMLARNAEVDVIVLVLIGERGREVKEFIQQQIGEKGMKKAVVVVATADKPAMMRVRAAYVGTAIAEYFRDQGKSVLLLMDSVTRYARALREIGLAAGEVPTRRGFPSSVFSNLPLLFERAGQSDKGSITAIYTVLVEGDDLNEPVSDESRSLLDGHIVLSTKLAQANHFPAIDVSKSLSRLMDDVASKLHVNAAQKIRKLIAKYQEIEFLVRMGEYQKGSDKLGDEALAKWDRINTILQQSTNQKIDMKYTVTQLKGLTF